ncbi:tryptophan--tRNA ligase [Bdellovibrio sp. HCB-162]|uniref:tryptophan--tRNA ligase n=1 Tax=Bdellovibrio sp. HCB-162 TaxID=3394234 RepID=UPI0039BD5EE2
MKPVILTGDRPTGPLHLGHYIGSLKNRVELQETHKQYLIIADAQAMTDNFKNPQMIRENIVEVALDYLAVGIDPAKSTIFVQSMIPELFEATFYFLNLVTVARLERNPTVKTEIAQKDFERNLPVGFLTYPVSQAADILCFKADVVPVGDDQNPMIEQTNEIAQRFNHLYNTELFKKVKALGGTQGRLPGIDGKAKMSKSLGNSISLAEPFDQLKKKVQKMYTDPNHLHIEDPGQVEGNVVFTFLDAFDPNKEEVEKLKDHYRRGGLGDGTVKQRLTQVLEEMISPIRKRREEFAKDKGEVLEICRKGSEQAREVVAQTVAEMKKIMGVGSI